MNFLRFAVLALASITFLSACKEDTKPVAVAPVAPVAPAAPAYPMEAQAKLPTIKLFIGPKEIDAEVAIEMNQLQTGLMYRKEMPENDGMLFVFPIPHQASFWMKNCSIPLSIAYIDPDGVVAEIHDMQPFNTNSVKAVSVNIQYALEMNQGWFKKSGVEVGASIRTPMGTLKETFPPNR